MTKHMDKFVAKAGWLRLLVLIVLLAVYSVAVFFLPGPWRNILKALGVSAENVQQSLLPDIHFGLAPELPALAFEKMGTAVSDYLIFQAIDVPYALIDGMMVATAIALGLKSLNWTQGRVRFLLLVPLIYFCLELVENILLSLMASEVLPNDGTTVFLQQVATTLKLGFDGLNSLLLIGSILAAAIVAVRRRLVAVG